MNIAEVKSTHVPNAVSRLHRLHESMADYGDRNRRIFFEHQVLIGALHFVPDDAWEWALSEAIKGMGMIKADREQQVTAEPVKC